MDEKRLPVQVRFLLAAGRAGIEKRAKGSNRVSSCVLLFGRKAIRKMNQEWKIEVKLTVEDIFFFLLRHSFSTWQGKLTWGLGAAALIGAPVVAAVWKDAFTAIIFLLVALIYLVISPLSLYTNAKRQMISNSVFKNKITFTIDSEMLQIKQYTGEAKLFWHQLETMDLNGKSYLLYVNSKQAFILPKRFIAAKDAAGLEKLLKEKQAELGTHRPEETGGDREKIKPELKDKKAQQDKKREKAEAQKQTNRETEKPFTGRELPDIKEILIRTGQSTNQEEDSAATEASEKAKTLPPEDCEEEGFLGDIKKKSEPKKKNANNRNKNK